MACAPVEGDPGKWTLRAQNFVPANGGHITNDHQDFHHMPSMAKFMVEGILILCKIKNSKSSLQICVLQFMIFNFVCYIHVEWKGLVALVIRGMKLF